MSHPLYDWNYDPPRQVKNDELLRKARLDWPRRVWARVRRGWNDALACAFFSFWSALHRLAKPAAVLAARAEVRCSARMRLAWHAFAPEDFTGEAENFAAQRGYDRLADRYDGLDAVARNAMVATIEASRARPRGLQDHDACEMETTYARE
jgi:hypothetical protein